MDETNPVYENFRNKMRAFGEPIRGTTRRISASKFLGKDDIGTQVAINSRKITILKNVIQAQQIQTGAMLSSLSGGSVKGVEENIMDIRETMTSILETLKAQEKFELKKFRDMQRRLENEKRRGREGFLERLSKSGMNVIKRGVNKVLTPVRNMFSSIIGFFTKLFLGKIMVSFLSFFSNPANVAIVDGIANFIGTFFPVIVAGIVAATVGIAALAVKMIGLTGVLRAAAIGLGLTNPLSSLLGLGLGGRGVDIGLGKGMKMSKIPNLGIRKGVSDYGSKFLFNLKRIPMTPLTSPIKGFNRGGVVPGSGNSDTVPAMLTPGEVVISKPAVDMFGLRNLLGLNRAAGSSNKPTMRSGVSYANEGMVAGDIMGLFNSLINTANQIPESPFGKKMVGFEDTMRDAAVNIGNKVTNEDLSEIKNLKNTVPNFLLSGGSKPTVPTNIIKNLKDTSQNLLPVMTQTFNVDDSPIGDLKEILNKSFNNPDLTPESFDNELNQVSLLEPSVDKLNTLGLFA
tara:strand:- start:1061 stop:2602 length:1542 start_codon:yes stop_codon:yes gene_type:complete